MVAGRKGGGEFLFLGSDGGSLDPVRPCSAALCFFDRFNLRCWINSQEAGLVGSRGGGRGCTWLRLSSICAQWAAVVMVVAALPFGLHRVAGRRLPAALQERGAVLEIVSLWIHVVELSLLSDMQLKHTNLEPSVVLQGSLHMRKGISSLVSRCSTRLKAAMQGMCWTVCDLHLLKVTLDAAMWALLFDSNSSSIISNHCMDLQGQNYLFANGRSIVTKEQDFLKSYGCTMLSLHDGDHAEETVLLLFGLFHQMWTTTRLLLIPRFNNMGILRLSSVMVHIYLQLNSPLPQVHTPDRPSGEPPAGHQLVWSTEALGDCGCGIFESELSTDDRWLIGSIGDLRFLHVFYRCRPSLTYCVQLGTSVISCSVLESYVMMYCVL